MVGSQPSNNKPQWRPGGTKPTKGGKPSFSGAVPTMSSSSRRRGENDRVGGFKSSQQQQYSKPWRGQNNNDTMSEVGSVACSVMTPQRQDYNRQMPSEQVNEQLQIMVRKEKHEDSTAESNPKGNGMNEQELQGVEENGKQILTSANGGATSSWNLNKQQIQFLANLGNEMIKISKTGIIKINQDNLKNITNDPSIVTIAAIINASKFENKKSIFKSIIYILIILLLIVFLGALIVTLLVLYSLVVGKLYVM